MAFSFLFSKEKDAEKVAITNRNIERYFSYEFLKKMKELHETNTATKAG